MYVLDLHQHGEAYVPTYMYVYSHIDVYFSSVSNIIP